MSWAYAYAFRAGAGHGRCDDICVCETLGDYIIAAVSDGAGSARKAHVGAALACQTFVEMAVPLFAGTIEPSCLIAAIQERLPVGEAEAHSCTFVGVVAGPKGAMILQVGDGAAVVRTARGAVIGRDADATCSATSRAVESVVKSAHSKEAALIGGAADGTSRSSTYAVPLWPEETEFLNHTFFITAADAEEHMRVLRIDEPVAEIALFTDGLQHLVLDLKTQSPHQPFFESVFKRLSDIPEHDLKASWWLERTLGSEPVTKRTDDDTSLIVARRIMC